MINASATEAAFLDGAVRLGFSAGVAVFEHNDDDIGHHLDLIRRADLLLLVVGLYVIAHGHLSPGGGRSNQEVILPPFGRKIRRYPGLSCRSGAPGQSSAYAG